VSLRLYDTRSRAVRPFTPLVEGRVGLYVCGPTVQAAPHVGHVRSAIAFDVLRRWLAESGYEVTLVRNVTDIDDKILRDAAAQGIPFWQLAERQTRAFNRAYDALGVLPPTAEPRATGHVPEMLALIATLIETGYAYPAGGDVYFDVRKLASYGELSCQSPDNLQSGEPTTTAKHDPLDFALWKGAKPGEPSWDTPWGPGRPGWHLECSAMVARYLGSEFDIHGGGLDLVFPHHENELAQSTAAGHGFARWWVHNGLVTTAGEKMSKSVGNSTVVGELLDAGVRPQVLRYALGAAHYRSGLEWSDDVLIEATSAYARLETFVRNAADAADGQEGVLPDDPWPQFATALDDDLAVPRALAALHGAVGRGNAALADDDRTAVAGWLAAVRRMLRVLGLDPASWPPAGDSALQPVVDALVRVALQARADARARRDYAAADAVRDALSAAGIVVEDTPAGARWRLAQPAGLAQ